MINARERPNLQILFFHENEITLLVVISARVSISTYLVKYPIATMMHCFFPSALENGPNISIIVERKVMKMK